MNANTANSVALSDSELEGVAGGFCGFFFAQKIDLTKTLIDVEVKVNKIDLTKTLID